MQVNLPYYELVGMLIATKDLQIMESQKPFMGGPPLYGGHSAAQNIMELLRTMVLYYVPSLWARRLIVALVIIYFTPRVLASWLESLARLIEIYRHWRRQLGDDSVQVVQRKH